MKKILTAALALTIAGGAAASANAQSYSGHYGQSGYGQSYGHSNNYGRSNNYYGNRNAQPQPRYNRQQVRQQRRWARGQYMPSQYRSRAYVVNDYRSHRLAPPPRGYQYVRDGNDVVLAAVATGLIAMVIAGAMR